jgi:uncharacterized phosphosugar-binding protein
MRQTDAFAEAERAFTEWRQRRGSGASKAIPEELWARAVGLARVHGATRTAKRLRLNQARLKQRSEARDRDGFVELAASDLPLVTESVVGESVVELEDAAGARMRLTLRGVSLAAVTAAAKELWGAAR